MSKGLIHATAHKSFWSGRVRALCGHVEQAGQYETLWFRSTPTCPACKKILKRGGQRK